MRPKEALGVRVARVRELDLRLIEGQLAGCVGAGDPGGTRICLRYDYELEYGIAGRVLGVLMRPVFARACRQMLDSYEAAS